MKKIRVLRLKPGITEPDLTLDKNDKYKVKFARMMSGIPSVIAIRKIKRSAEHITFQNKTYVINFNEPAYRQKNTFYFMIDVDKAQMRFESPAKWVSADINHSVLRRSGLRQLIMGMERRKMADILIYIILAIAVGIMGGYLLGNVMPMSMDSATEIITHMIR